MGFRPAQAGGLLTAAQSEGLDALLDHIHHTETTDPHGQRWPRSKPHDDKTAALVTFHGHGQDR
ncbi:hypothetical protein [Phytoactinopolyspora mesophila]|uniref:Uncharacterized protein n=1 Tax=Phytoactinopolyspora mesophila TaxID=2650750 RepID=A0A7K3M3U7_9ACTN|nr:hypothetical protein [Phytoactinopolyspora mesophila]NDL57916.1 hypothetical protein [Phytoactinopolyspora mesophila]